MATETGAVESAEDFAEILYGAASWVKMTTFVNSIRERDALVRRAALEEAARIADDWRKHDGPDISRRIRALFAQEKAD